MGVKFKFGSKSMYIKSGNTWIKNWIPVCSDPRIHLELEGRNKSSHFLSLELHLPRVIFRIIQSLQVNAVGANSELIYFLDGFFYGIKCIPKYSLWQPFCTISKKFGYLARNQRNNHLKKKSSSSMGCLSWYWIGPFFGVLGGRSQAAAVDGETSRFR